VTGLNRPDTDYSRETPKIIILENVVILTPPPHEPGAVPINMSIMVKNRVSLAKSPICTVLY